LVFLMSRLDTVLILIRDVEESLRQKELVVGMKQLLASYLYESKQRKRKAGSKKLSKPTGQEKPRTAQSKEATVVQPKKKSPLIDLVQKPSDVVSKPSTPSSSSNVTQATSVWTNPSLVKEGPGSPNKATTSPSGGKPHPQVREETKSTSQLAASHTSTTSVVDYRNSSVDNHIEKSAKVGKWDIDRRKWVARRKRLEEKGVNLACIKTGLEDERRWNGVSTSRPDPPREYYMVTCGRQIGVFKSWAECQSQTTRFPGAKYKKVKMEEREVIRHFEELLSSSDKDKDDEEDSP